MSRTAVIVLLVIAIVMTSCAPIGAPLSITPVPEAKVSQATATEVPARGSFTSTEGNVIVTPVPMRVPTPPTLQGSDSGLQVYYYYEPINFQQMGVVVMPMTTFAGGAALLDGPLPVGDVVGILVLSGTAIAYVVYKTAVPAGAIYYQDPADLAAMLALWGSLLAYIPVSPEHKAEHTVVLGSTNVATQVFTELYGKWPPKNGDQTYCYLLKAGEEVLRFLVWSYTGTSATGVLRGNLNWWQFGPSGPEAYGYRNKSFNTMESVPTDLQGKGYTITKTSCDNHFPPFSLIGH
jgi:hypothetical protein